VVHVHDRERMSETSGTGSNTLVVLGLGVLAGAVGYAYYQSSGRNRVQYRPPDAAPGRTARQRRFGDYAVVGRTVTINRPRTELYRFWRDFRNLPKFMQSVRAVTVEGELTRWTIAAPLGREISLETRIVDDREGELIAWRAIEGSDVETEGKVTFRDAPAGRGTEVEAIVAYVPPAGEIGRLIAKLFQAEPSIQGRRELKRFKMLMETGEIATSSNRKTAA
jgi:uncharacterized membrane protein